MILVNKYPCVECDGKLRLTDYTHVYDGNYTYVELQEMDIREARIEGTSLIIKVPLTPTSKMLKIGCSIELTIVQVAVEDFMLPLMKKESSSSIHIFLQIIKDIQEKLINGNPIDQLREELDTPDELFRRALLNSIDG